MKRRMTRVLSLVLCMLLFLSAAAGMVSAEAEKAADRGKDWMADVADHLTISDINIPGSHDSGSQYITPSLWMSCQKTTIKEQLEMGVRYLDIRLKLVEKNGERKLILTHSVFSCRNSTWWFGNQLDFDTVLQWCYDFLNENPTEMLFMTVKIETGEEEGFVETFFGNYVNQNLPMWFLDNHIPILHQVRGKIVLARRFEIEGKAFTGAGGLDFTQWDGQDETDVYTAEKYSLYGSDIGEGTYYVQDRYKLSRKDKWENAAAPYLKSQIEDVKENQIFINFFSTAASFLGPKYNSTYINKQFLNSDYMEAGTRYGWLIFDHVTPELCKAVYETNFVAEAEDDLGIE